MYFNSKCRRTLLVFLLSSIFFSHSGYTQKISIKWSPEFTEEKGEYLNDILFDDGTNLYVRVTHKDKKSRGKDGGITPGILKLDKEMNPVARENYTTSQEDIKLQGLFYYAGQFAMITSKYDKASNSTEVYAVAIDKSSLKPSGSTQTIWKLSAPPKKDFYWGVRVSDDSTKLVFTSTFEQKDDEMLKFAYKVVDKDFKSIQEKLVTLPYKVDDFRILDKKVSSKGDLYIIGKGYKPDARKETERTADKKKVSTYDIVIIRYNRDGTEKEYRIPMGEKSIDTYAMRNDPATDDLFLMGSYQSTSNDGVIGYFFNRIKSTTGDVMVAKTHEFPLSFIEKVNQLNDDKTKGKNPGISQYFNICDFMVLPNDVIYAIIEKRYSVTTSSKTMSYTTYFSNSMIAIQLDKNGEQKWINHIPKSQFFNSLTSYIYYSTMVFDNKLNIIYNETEKNLNYNLNSDEAPKRFNELKDMHLMMVQIDENGKMKRSELTNSTKAGMPFFIGGSTQTTPNHFLIYGYRFGREANNKLGMAVFEK